MPLSDKELETFLWEHPADCARRGLHVDYGFYRFGRRYRRLSLGPYGVAPLVNVRYWPPERAYYMQVMVFTRAALTVTLYQQAKRYQTALRAVLRQALRAAGIVATVVPSCVLIGQRVQVKGDFVYLLNFDDSCQAFTYAYDMGGIRFEHVGKYWQLTGNEDSLALSQLAADLLCQREEALADGHGQADSAEQQVAESLVPEHLATLVVTAEGILLNEAREGTEEYE